LVALDVHTGDVLAYVSADPSRSDVFDRVRSARRQPGSAVKPLLLLEAFSQCGGRQPLHPATRVADAPLTLELPEGQWSPRNPDGEFHGVVDIRQAVSQSLNVPFVRVADHCGYSDTADRVRKAGLVLPEDPPPSFVLGSMETTPLELLTAYSAIATPGAAVQPRPVLRLEAPGGRNLGRYGVRRTRVTGAEAAYLVHDLLREAAATGTARGVQLPDLVVAAKTGTSSGGRDAWLAGGVGGVVAVVWVGRDDGQPMGLSGAASAAPIWRDFMAVAARARPARTTPQPDGIVSAFVDPETGLRVKPSKKGAQEYLFRKGAMPRKNRPILRDRPETIIE
jgi:penicillin-binding protein 1B